MRSFGSVLVALPLFGAALTISLAQPAHAQASMSEGALTGDVIDGDSGEPIAGVVVTATSPSMQGKLTSTSDAQGKYRIDGLPPGSYTLTFTKEGYVGEPISDVQLRAGATLRYDAVAYREGSALSSGSSGEVVRVTATAPVVDVGSTQTGGVINSDIARRVPLVAPGGRGGAQRSFESAAVAMPQAQADNYGVSINGSTSVENQYVIDGISVNNSAYGYLGSPLSLEFIEEVSIVTGGYLPEYGRSMGGLMNVITKSGSNEYHGSVFTTLSPGFLEGERTRPPNVGSAIGMEQKLNYVGDIGFELGGPLLRDTLWFYAGADVNQTSFKVTRNLFRADGSEIPGTTQDFFAEGTGVQAIAKLTWLANADNKVSFSLFATPTVSGGIGKMGIDFQEAEPEDENGVPLGEGSFDALSHVYRAGALDAQIKWQSALLERKLRLDTSVGWHYEIGGRQPSDGSTIGSGEGLASVPRVFFRRAANPGFHPITDFETLPPGAGCDEPGTAGELCPVTTYQAGGPDFIDTSTYQGLAARHVTTFLTDLLGLHVIKAGAELGWQGYDHEKAYSGGVRFRDNLGGTLFTDNRMFGFLQGPDDPVILDSVHWQTSSVFLGTFLQDSWSAFDVVTVNLGLRYDAQWIFAGDGQMAMALPNQISPRAGLIFDPFQSGRAKLYGSYARYYESIPLDIADRAGSSEPQITSGRPAALCDPLDPKQYDPEGGSCFNEDNKIALNDTPSPNQKWVVIGAGKTAVDPNLQPPSSDEIVLGGEMEIFRDARVGVSYTKRWLNVAIEDMSRDEANTYFIGNPGFGISQDFDKAVRDYDAVTLLFHKQWSDEWLMQASYTLSFLRGNYAGLFRPETGQLDPNINSDFDLKSLTVNRNGPLPFDRTHSAKAFAAKEFKAAYDTKFTLGGAASYLSGAPTNFLGSHPIYGDQEVFVVPRGLGARTPDIYSADVHGGFTFQPVKGQSVEVTVDVFNMFNFQAATLLDEEFTADDVNPLQNCVDGQRDSCGTADLDKVVYTDGTPYDATVSNNPNFGQALVFQAPRTVRFGLRWAF